MNGDNLFPVCKKYAEPVPKPTKAGAEKRDTCTLIEPIDAAVPEDSGYIPERNAEPGEFPHTVSKHTMHFLCFTLYSFTEQYSDGQGNQGVTVEKLKKFLKKKLLYTYI